MVQRDFSIQVVLSMIFPLVATWGHPYLAGPLGLVNWLVAGFAIIHYFVSGNPLNLAGGLEHFLCSIYWEFHHAN